MRRLTAEETERLVALLSPALSLDQLETYVYLATGDRLYVEFVPEGALPLKPMLRKLIAALELGPVTDRFLRVVYREKPFQTDLLQAIAKLYPEIPEAVRRVPVQFGFQQAGISTMQASDGPGLERVVRPALSSPDTQVWLDQFEQVKRRVCRIEVNQSGIGTGFLVGPSAVLTNWHVVEEARKVGLLDQVSCRFDYRKLTGGGTDPGTLLATAGVADELPCSDAELTDHPDAPPPTAQMLDYALLRLATPVPERGWFQLAEPPPIGEHAALIIVQHPQGDPLRFAIDTDAVIGFVHGGLRLRYNTNTQAGSSGSPCFSLNWDLQALHHLGDPAAGPGTYNQGVPIGLVRQSLLARGAGALLGA